MLRPDLNSQSPDYLTYTHGLVPTLPPANYSRATMNIVDHIYIGILPKSAHVSIRRFFSAFVQQQQRAHEHNFHRPTHTPPIMAIYWDNARFNKPLLTTLQCLNPHNHTKLYHLISRAWDNVTIALLQRARNIQTIIEALVYNRSRSSNLSITKPRQPLTLPTPCGRNLVQTIMHPHLAHIPNTTPSGTPILLTPKRVTHCRHPRCDLYASAGLNRGVIRGKSLYCPVYHIFNHAAQHTHHIERALTRNAPLRRSLADLTYTPDTQQPLLTTRALHDILRTYPSHNIAPLLRSLRAQHKHLYTTTRPNHDPDTYNPQSPLTHALQNVARTINAPSSHHSLANPLPTQAQQHQRYIRAASLCPCPPRADRTK